MPCKSSRSFSDVLYFFEIKIVLPFLLYKTISVVHHNLLGNRIYAQMVVLADCLFVSVHIGFFCLLGGKRTEPCHKEAHTPHKKLLPLLLHPSGGSQVKAGMEGLLDRAPRGKGAVLGDSLDLCTCVNTWFPVLDYGAVAKCSMPKLSLNTCTKVLST